MRLRGFLVARSMCRAFGWLILAIAMFVVAASESWARMPQPKRMSAPVPATIKLAKSSGPALSGEITGWSRADLTLKLKDGSEQAIAWRDILPQQVYELRRRLIDQKDAMEWLDLGALMLAMNADGQADPAFAMAVKLDEKTKPLVTTCRAASARKADPQKALYDALVEAVNEAMSKEAGKQTDEDADSKGGEKNKDDGDPEAAPEPGFGRGERGVRPWPVLKPAEQAELLAAWQSKIDASFQKHGVRMRTKESEHFRLYSVLGESDVQRILGLLEATYTAAASLLEFDPNTNIFVGKTAVFVFPVRSQWVEFEKDHFGFGYEQTKDFGGFCHTDGPLASLCFFRSADEQKFMFTLSHEAAHAIVFRVKTPARLPTWANEGLAEFIAAQVCTTSNGPSEQWQKAHSFAAQKNSDPLSLIRRNYRDGSWPGDDGLSYPVSHMITRYLIKRDQAAYKAWFADIKGGAGWKVAIEARFGAPVESIMAEFMKDMRTERAYTRVTLKRK